MCGVRSHGSGLGCVLVLCCVVFLLSYPFNLTSFLLNCNMERPLIDFSSPESPAKQCLDPLIPSHPFKAPEERSSFLLTAGAPESNPFDMVANETAAHTAAEGDPFEVAFLEALNGNKNDCNVVAISPKMPGKTGSDASLRDDSLRVREEIAMKIDSITKEVLSEDRYSDISECKVVSGKIRRGLLDRLSILNLEDILPPDLLDSSFGGSPKLVPADESVGCIEILKSNSPTLSSPKGVVISPKMPGKAGSDASQRDDGLKVREEIAMKIDSITKEVLSEDRYSDISECKGVSGKIRRGLLDRLSILNLEDILPPDLLDSSFGGSPKLVPADESVGCIDMLKSNSPTLTSPKCLEQVPIPPVDFTFNSVLDDKKLPSEPEPLSPKGTSNESLNVTGSPFSFHLLHTIKSDKELQAMITKRIEKVIQAAQNQLHSKPQVLKSPYVRQESSNGVEQCFTELKTAGNVESALNIPTINDSKPLIFNSSFGTGHTSINVSCESPVFDEPVFAKEANVLSNIFSASAHNLLDIKDDSCDLLMCEQPPDWNSLHLPELSDDEMELIERAAEMRTHKVLFGKVESLSPPAQSKTHSSAHRRSKSADCQSRALPTSSPPALPPLPLCEEAIRSLTLSSKFLPPQPSPNIQKTKSPSAIRSPQPTKPCTKQKSLPVEPVTAQTRFLLRKKSDSRTTNLSQRGPLKATLPVKSMTRTNSSPHVAKGNFKIGPPVKYAHPKVVISSPLHEDLHSCASPAAVSMSSSIHAHKPAANILRTRSSGKSLIPSCSPVPRGNGRSPAIPSGNSASYLRPPQSSLAAHNRDNHTLKQSPSRRSLLPAMSHSKSAEPTPEIYQKKIRNVSLKKSPLIVQKMGTLSAKPKTPLQKSSSNPRVLTDVNTLQAGWATPTRKRSLVPSPRPARRTHFMEKENVHS